MFKGLKHNDLVLNFYRQLAYRYSPEFYKFDGDLNRRCRLATFDEIKKFNELGRVVVPLSELLGKRENKWSGLENKEVSFIVNDAMQTVFYEIKESQKAQNYSQIIGYLSAVYTRNNKVEINKLKVENRILKEKINKINEIIKK